MSAAAAPISGAIAEAYHYLSRFEVHAGSAEAEQLLVRLVGAHQRAVAAEAHASHPLIERSLQRLAERAEAAAAAASGADETRVCAMRAAGYAYRRAARLARRNPDTADFVAPPGERTLPQRGAACSCAQAEDDGLPGHPLEGAGDERPIALPRWFVPAVVAIVAAVAVLVRCGVVA